MQRAMVRGRSVGLLMLALGLAGCPPAGRPPVLRAPAPVRGYLAVAVRVPTPHDVYLPGLKVRLVDANGGAEVASVITDLSGRFDFAPQKAGSYQLCWEGKGYLSECRKPPLVLAGVPVHLSRIQVSARSQAGERSTVLVSGKVLLADGTSPRRMEPLSSANAFASVTLLDAGGRELQRVPVNTFDQYVLPEVPGKARLVLRASSEAGLVEQRIEPQANLIEVPQHDINLNLRNRAPRLEGLVPLDGGGHRMQAAAPGDVVFLAARATDPDGDALRYAWSPTAGSGTVSSKDAQQIKWTLPATAGRYEITLTTWDGKGGYARDLLSLVADGKGARFSGVVAGTDVATVAGAKVEVNGKLAETGTDGFFDLLVPPAGRYVMNIRRQGYAHLSKVHDGPVTGGRFTLLKASETVVDPAKDIDVTEQRDRRNCTGTASSRMDWKRWSALLSKPQYQDGKGESVGRPVKPRSPILLPSRSEGRGCGPGTRVRIPANSIVDLNGRAPRGTVTMSVATFDLSSPDQMPGDYTVKDEVESKVMQSWGAVFVELRAGSAPLNLKSGATADVTIPVDPTQLAAGVLPPNIPILFYDEASGVWKVDGSATLSGTVYRATVKHFSTINTDLVKTDQACVRVLSSALPGSYRLEATIPMSGGAAPKVIDRLIDNSTTNEHVLYNLPTNTHITLVPYDPVSLQPYGVFVVDTGQKQNPTSPNLPAGPPYLACSTQVVLHAISLPATVGPFLEGLLDFQATNLTELDPTDPAQAALATNLDTATGNYYGQIDPCHKRSTLSAFRSTNNYAAGETRAAYANAVDLGFGRDMHCAQSGPNVACYVTNYGNEPTDDQIDANDAQQAGAGSPAVATVAMEYSPIETTCDDPDTAANEEVLDTVPTVKFFVYNGAGSALLRSANLDGLGARPIPQLCMVCHGGAYPGGANTGVPAFTSIADVKLGSRYLPFDAAAYVYPNNDPNFTKANQQDELQALNNMVYATEATGSSVRELIDAWYAGGLPQNESAVVPGWNSLSGHQAMYRNVVARSCRTCHVTNPFPTLQLRTAADTIARLASIEGRVCVEHVMPHSLRTHNRFWNSIAPNQVAQLQAFGDAFGAGTGWTGNKCGDFTAGGTTPVTLFSGTIQPHFEGVGTGTAACTNCHVGNAPAGTLRLDAAYSYSQLVNVSASELGTMHRVEPGNAAQSYLVHKLDGTSGTVGGNATQMPPGGPPMSNPAQTDITTWINPPNNAAP